MRIDSAALPFVALAVVPAVVAFVAGYPVAGAILLLMPAAVALFFRDPERTSPTDPALVLAPADGKVMHAGPARPAEAPPGEWLQVTIFLSVLDVHINRTPVSGRVVSVDYIPGTFRAAFRHDAHENERSEIWMESGGVPIVFRQVVGLLARRVVCRIRPGDQLGIGERMGLMKFGSRMDVFVPTDATILIGAGDRVRGGLTPLARLAPAPQSPKPESSV